MLCTEMDGRGFVYAVGTRQREHWNGMERDVKYVLLATT